MSLGFTREPAPRATPLAVTPRSDPTIMKSGFALCAFVLTLVFLATVAPNASAAPASARSFTTTLTVEPTAVGSATISGAVTANVTQFRLDSNGRVVAIATLNGALTVTHPRLGTGTVDVTGTRIVLIADVDADCQGHLKIDFHTVLQLRATVTLTSRTGATTSLELKETVSLHGSLGFTAQTAAQRALICEIANIIEGSGSLEALVEKLNALLHVGVA
ncbi:MAG: hypothetical protein ICV59_02950 [Thermoleophilia bacterium]|nr:hypothetical protein [Thermoleophilia bacterium]